MVLLIDNYDSFTYNLYQMIGEFDENIITVRNDKITVEQIRKYHPNHIVISPGPKTPSDAGNCKEIIKELYKEYPILGVCLGHQCIGEVFGGKVLLCENLVHGKSEIVSLKEDLIFKNINKETEVARYHSLIVETKSLPECLEILSETANNEIMAIKHKNYNVYGLQFHPESILTKDGKKIIKNFIEEIRR